MHVLCRLGSYRRLRPLALMLQRCRLALASTVAAPGAPSWRISNLAMRYFGAICLRIDTSNSLEALG